MVQKWSGQNRGQREKRTGIAKPSQDELRTIICGDDIESAELTVQWGQSLGTALKGTLKAAQIRMIFGKARQIEMGWQMDSAASHRELLLLKPKLRYQAERKEEVEDLADVLTKAIDLVKTQQHFQRFMDFFEAILAYHKAAGGN